MQRVMIPQMDIDEPHSLPDDLDLACSITGLYRVLDLMTEQGSGGLGSIPCRGQRVLAHSYLLQLTRL